MMSMNLYFDINQQHLVVTIRDIRKMKSFIKNIMNMIKLNMEIRRV